MVDGYLVPRRRVPPHGQVHDRRASSPTRSTTAWCRWSSTSARRCSTSTSGRSGSASPPGWTCPARARGSCRRPSQWWGDERYTLSFGQGVAVNAVQMASVYATIANGGVRVQPSIVAGTTSGTGKFTPAPAPRQTRVLQPKTAKRADRRSCSRCPWSTRGRRAVGHHPGVLDRGQDRHRAGCRPGASCLCEYGVELHRHRAGQRPAARGGGERPGPHARAATSATRSPGRSSTTWRSSRCRRCGSRRTAPRPRLSARRAAHRAVNRGNLCPCQRICAHAVSLLRPLAGLAVLLGVRTAGRDAPGPLSAASGLARGLRDHPRFAPRAAR